VVVLAGMVAAGWVWTKVDHWVLLAAAIIVAALGAMAWTWVIRRRKRCWLYVYPHRTLPGQLRYIGISTDPDARHGKHRDKSWWFSSSSGEMKIVKCFPSWAKADAAETEMIQKAALAGHPLANDRKVPAHIRQARIDAGHVTRGWSGVV
jgi:predicted GIY-YIG superfamily endonuclease